MNNTTGVGFISAIATALANKPNWINKVHCLLTEHDDKHTEQNRNNNLRQLELASKTCNRCGRYEQERL